MPRKPKTKAKGKGKGKGKGEAKSRPAHLAVAGGEMADPICTLCEPDAIPLEPCTVCELETKGARRTQSGKDSSPQFTHTKCLRAVRQMERVADAKDKASGHLDRPYRKALALCKANSKELWKEKVLKAIVVLVNLSFIRNQFFESDN